MEILFLLTEQKPRGPARFVKALMLLFLGGFGITRADSAVICGYVVDQMNGTALPAVTLANEVALDMSIGVYQTVQDYLELNGMDPVKVAKLKNTFAAAKALLEAPAPTA